MNKKHLFILFAVAGLSLASCADTSELYNGNAYDTGSFVGNYYDVYEDKFNERSTITKDVSVTPANLRLRTSDYSTRTNSFNAEDMISEDGYVLAYPGVTDSKSGGNGVDYGYTKNLSSINNKFARGYVSKLFDGRVQCFGHYAKSRVQIKESGFGFKFDSELMSYKYLAISLRGASDYETSKPRISVVDLNVTFYIHNYESDTYSGVSFHMSNLTVPTDAGGSEVCLYGFYFADVLSDTSILKRASAMSIDYKLVYDSVIESNPSVNHALMLYEVLLPNSSWN